MSTFQSILVTGGAGFIGSHLVRRLLQKYPKTQILNLDALTYAGNLDNLKDCENTPNYEFVHGDINNFDFLQKLFKSYCTILQDKVNTFLIISSEFLGMMKLTI